LGCTSQKSWLRTWADTLDLKVKLGAAPYSG